MQPGENAAEAPAGGEGQTPSSVESLLIDAIEDLSVVTRILEKWAIFTPSLGVSDEIRQQEREKFDLSVAKGRQRVSEHLRRFMRKSRKLSEVAFTSLDAVNIPLDLVQHVDYFLSPNLWMRGLLEEIDYLNAVTRGELLTLGSLHATLECYLDVLEELDKEGLVSIPDFSLPYKPPTDLRPPLTEHPADAVDLTQILGLLKGPLQPISSDPCLR